jgi:hypothetical protein
MIVLFRYTATEKAGLAVMLWACIRVERDRISVRIWAILTETFRNYPQSLHLITAILYRICYGSFIQYSSSFIILHPIKKKNSVFLVRKRTIPTEWPPLVGEVSANFSG